MQLPGFFSEEKETEENKELTDPYKERESDIGKKKVEHEISEGNVATAAAAALASAATKAKVCLPALPPSSLVNGRVVLVSPGHSGHGASHPKGGRCAPERCAR